MDIHIFGFSLKIETFLYDFLLYRNVDFDNRATLKLSYQYSMNSFLSAKYLLHSSGMSIKDVRFLGSFLTILFMIISGERFAFGYHYLQPNETYHEPTRKFFRNEVFRIPIYEVLPLETIWQQCWVMDIQSFCRAFCRTLKYP